ncbi:type II toxin -antitoxin system TacA 1-like antitoxin [Streptomyces sp. NPDC001939]
MANNPKALNLRFPDPAQRAAIEAAARQEGMSLQEYILSAAVDKATAVERKFLAAFEESMARSGAAFRAASDSMDPGPEHRAAEQRARRDLDAHRQEHAA